MPAPVRLLCSATMSDPDSILFIDTPEALERFCARIADADWLALDTEFLREKTYYPRLCLLQAATPELTACIDPLALEHLDPLLERLYDPAVTKVMHACHQDLEILFQLRGSVPAPIFDTQLAAPLLGHAEQIGYGNLVEAVLGVKLEKGHARADWTRRPLPEAQLRYAADDVIYLARLYPILREALAERGRLAWLDEDFAGLSDPERYIVHPEQAWQRIRSAERMRGPRLAVLQALAAWREETARREDRPRGWLMRDEVLEDIARQLPAGMDDLARVRGLHEQTLRRNGEALLAVVREARDRTPAERPAHRRSERCTPGQEALVELLEAVVHRVGLEESLNPAVLAPRKALERLVRGEPTPELARGWRRALVGDDLHAVLRGERAVTVEDGHLRLIPVT